MNMEGVAAATRARRPPALSWLTALYKTEAPKIETVCVLYMRPPSMVCKTFGQQQQQQSTRQGQQRKEVVSSIFYTYFLSETISRPNF